ncbi:MAG: CDP-diacylglycerol--serine O-phosphatidyltransferase [Candidatus Rokubacteria bacterium]|nr:CDP-diacylglycerol--serine O-phosphatidyltransferase [Candidatus Rokubacteria bacterium]
MIRRRHAKAARRRRWEGLQEKRSRSIFLLPSLLTTGNLFCGFLALLLTVQERYTEAAISVFVAGVMDLLDGRVARLMKATSQFGVEYDSLADVVSFGVAPAFLVYSFALAKLGRPAWFAAFLFVICGALRLARFNVFTGVADKRFFTGLSIPMAAGVICSSVVFVNTLEPSRAVLVAMAIGMYLVALLMVSTFKYWSFKDVGWAKRHPAQALLVVVLGVMIVATNPELFVFILFTGYALSGPVRRLIVGRAPLPEPAPVKEI